MKLLLLCVCVALAHGLAPLRQPRQGERAVPDSWIVALKEGSDPSQVKSDILDVFAKRRMPRPIVNGATTFPMLFLRIPAEVMDEVRAIDGIEEVEADLLGTIFTSEKAASWGIDRIDNRYGTDSYYTYNDNRLGAGVRIYIMDTGIQLNHRDFGGRGHHLYGGADDHGHGTHCSGTFAGSTYGVARQAEIYSLKVCNSWGQCPLSDLYQGFDEIRKDYANDKFKLSGGVVSMSLGFSKSATINNYVSSMNGDGLTVSVAAGNSNADACNVSPASAPGAITVGATDVNDNRAYFSNWGNCLDIFAPGVDILSAGYSTWSNQASAKMSGTSMACPHVSGAAAVYLGANPGASAQQVHDALVTDSTSDIISDPRSPNKLLYVNPN